MTPLTSRWQLHHWTLTILHQSHRCDRKSPGKRRVATYRRKTWGGRSRKKWGNKWGEVVFPVFSLLGNPLHMDLRNAFCIVFFRSYCIFEPQVEINGWSILYCIVIHCYIFIHLFMWKSTYLDINLFVYIFKSTYLCSYHLFLSTYLCIYLSTSYSHYLLINLLIDLLAHSFT